MPTWKKICLDLAVLVALGVAVNTPGTELVCSTGTAPGILSSTLYISNRSRRNAPLTTDGAGPSRQIRLGD
jgi:hypothetical protein